MPYVSRIERLALFAVSSVSAGIENFKDIL